MEKLDIRKLKSVLSLKGNYRTLAIAFVVMMIFYPTEGKFKYDYQKGSPWKYESLEAPFDFPILKSDKELEKEKRELQSQIIPFYSVIPEVEEKAVSHILSLVQQNLLTKDIAELLIERLKYIYSQGVVPNNVVLPDRVIIASSTSEEKLGGDVFSIEKANNYLLQGNEFDISLINNPSISKVIESIVIEPNLRFDKGATESIHADAVRNISPTKGVVYMGELIISQGELVTESTNQILDSFKAEYLKSVGYDGSIWGLMGGRIIIILTLFLLVYIAIYFSDYKILKRQNQFNFVIFILCFNLVVPMLIRKISPDLLYVVPIAVSALYLYAFVYNRVVLPIYTISLLPLLINTSNGVELFTISLTAGAVAFITYSIYDRGWQRFVSGLYIFLSTSIVHTAFSLLNNTFSVSGSFKIYLYLLFNAILVVMTYQLVVILEKLFRMVALSSFRELADTDNKLLRELAQKAPGTFQHSLQVANLAERAILSIGGNPKLVRVGALYHDIGKIMNPQAFVENQAPNVQYHKDLSPIESAAVIINHVDDGVKLARRYKLPNEIIDFILTHHAHSTAEYFYNTYCNNGGDPADIDKFTYHGELPVLKEHVVLMMADAVEAASRSLKEYSEESISNLVDSVVAKRVSSSQLEKADISFKEINSVKKIFKNMLHDIYHARITYPKLKPISKN